jgi:hypothetical protein
MENAKTLQQRKDAVRERLNNYFKTEAPGKMFIIGVMNEYLKSPLYLANDGVGPNEWIATIESDVVKFNSEIHAQEAIQSILERPRVNYGDGTSYPHDSIAKALRLADTSRAVCVFFVCGMDLSKPTTVFPYDDLAVSKRFDWKELYILQSKLNGYQGDTNLRTVCDHLKNKDYKQALSLLETHWVSIKEVYPHVAEWIINAGLSLV